MFQKYLNVVHHKKSVEFQHIHNSKKKTQLSSTQYSLAEVPTSDMPNWVTMARAMRSTCCKSPPAPDDMTPRVGNQWKSSCFTVSLLETWNKLNKKNIKCWELGNLPIQLVQFSILCFFVANISWVSYSTGRFCWDFWRPPSFWDTLTSSIHSHFGELFRSRRSHKKKHSHQKSAEIRGRGRQNVPFSNTLPETNIFAPENGWLEYYFPIGEAYFQGLR